MTNYIVCVESLGDWDHEWTDVLASGPEDAAGRVYKENQDIISMTVFETHHACRIKLADIMSAHKQRLAAEALEAERKQYERLKVKFEGVKP